MPALLETKNICKLFSQESGFMHTEKRLIKALDDISFSLEPFQTLGIVGESGSGKTTLAKIILKLIAPSSGEVILDQQIITDFRKDVQIIFQNPFNSLNPKLRTIDTICEPMIIHRTVPRGLLRQESAQLLNLVGLEEAALERYPAEFSGGQRQRICIARALASEPKFIVLDEPISSLDLTVQSQMLDLFIQLKRKLNLTYIFISHNLAVIKYIADKVIVMQNGRIVEAGECQQIFNAPRTDYTRILLDSARGK